MLQILDLVSQLIGCHYLINEQEALNHLACCATALLRVNDTGVHMAFRVEDEKVMVLSKENSIFLSGELKLLLIGESAPTGFDNRQDIDPTKSKPI